MKIIRTVAVFPTMFTLGNLVCGFFAIVVASRVVRPDATSLWGMDDPHNLMLSGWLIFAAMIFDALDGYVARLSRSASEFGKELDSLCDVVSFGVAPAFLLVKMCPVFSLGHREAIWVIAAAYAACAALRLARFNVETPEEDDHTRFTGLPSPAAAAAVASFGIMFYTLRNKEDLLVAGASQIDSLLQYFLPFYALGVALLMVSRVPYPHVVNQVFRGHRSFGHVVGVLFALVVIMVVRGYSMAILGCAFVFYGPIRMAYEKVVERRQQEDPLF
jgi:CDP-diacylglycerol---serine O-phosphatidyltransferase